MWQSIEPNHTWIRSNLPQVGTPGPNKLEPYIKYRQKHDNLFQRRICSSGKHCLVEDHQLATFMKLLK